MFINYALNNILNIIKIIPLSNKCITKCILKNMLVCVAEFIF